MAKFQLILDLDVTDETWTGQTIALRWKKAMPQLAGVTLTGISSVTVATPDPGQGLTRRLDAIPNLAAGIVTTYGKQGIETIGQLAELLPELHKLRGIGQGKVMQAVALCVQQGVPVDPQQLEKGPVRTYAEQLLARAI